MKVRTAARHPVSLNRASCLYFTTGRQRGASRAWTPQLGVDSSGPPTKKMGRDCGHAVALLLRRTRCPSAHRPHEATARFDQVACFYRSGRSLKTETADTK